MRSLRHFFQSDASCKECGTERCVIRSQGAKRENNHAKHMFCATCQVVTEHLENAAPATLTPTHRRTHKPT